MMLRRPFKNSFGRSRVDMPNITQVIQAYHLDKKKHRGYNQKILNNDGKQISKS
jgi:hypothetical protein